MLCRHSCMRAGEGRRGEDITADSWGAVCRRSGANTAEFRLGDAHVWQKHASPTTSRRDCRNISFSNLAVWAPRSHAGWWNIACTCTYVCNRLSIKVERGEIMIQARAEGREREGKKNALSAKHSQSTSPDHDSAAGSETTTRAPSLGGGLTITVEQHASWSQAKFGLRCLCWNARWSRRYQVTNNTLTKSTSWDRIAKLIWLQARVVSACGGVEQ